MSLLLDNPLFHIFVFLGSPVKAENIGRLKKHSKKATAEDDPRPPHMRNMPGYQSHVRSLVINYCATTNSDLSFRYLYRRADLQAAVADHDYLALPFTEYWVDEANKVKKYIKNNKPILYII